MPVVSQAACQNHAFPASHDEESYLERLEMEKLEAALLLAHIQVSIVTMQCYAHTKRRLVSLRGHGRDDCADSRRNFWS